MQKALKEEQALSCSQFELTTNTITKLYTFKLTPTAKLVLLYLTTCYNPEHREVFPKQKTIAEKIGISEASVIRAISELHKEGLIISERKYTNRYIFTSRIVSDQPVKMKDNKLQKERRETCNLQPPCKEQIKETKKEPTEMEEFKILREYAIKHGAKNVTAYINVLRKNGSAVRIIKEQKNREYVKRRAEREIEETQKLLKQYREYEKDAIPASQSEAWQMLGVKLGIKKKL